LSAFDRDGPGESLVCYQIHIGHHWGTVAEIMQHIVRIAWEKFLIMIDNPISGKFNWTGISKLGEGVFGKGGELCVCMACR
jgi:hypothetical protein